MCIAGYCLNFSTKGVSLPVSSDEDLGKVQEGTEFADTAALQQITDARAYNKSLIPESTTIH